MQDDAPWKPPSDAGEPTAPTPGNAPTLPADPAVVTSDAPLLPTLPPAAPTPPPPPPPPAPESPWSPGGAAAAPGAPVAPPPATPAAPPAPGATPPLVEPGPPPERPRRSKWLVGGAVAAVLAVGGAGVFAVANLTGSTAGGADGPEELGRELLVAIESEDVLGMIDVLSPGEREALGDPFVEMVAELQRLEVLAETDLSAISGLDIELTGEDVDVRPTNVVDIVNVDLRADVVVSIDGSQLPVGDLVIDNMPDEMVTEMRGTQITESDRLDIWLTAVEEDGRWYFSLLHSLAELARGEASPGAGIPAEGVGAAGADSPEAAVEQLFDHVEALDLAGVIRSLNPGEAAALQRYAPLFLDDAEAAIAELPLQWQITDTEIRVAGEGDRRTAFVDAIAIDGTFDGTPFELAYRDECLSGSMEGESFEQCTGDLALGSAGFEDVFGDEPELVTLFETIEAAFADIEPAGLELRRHEGAWYVSPIGTMTEAILKAFRALDRAELDAIIAAVGPAIDSFEDVLAGSFEDLAGGGVMSEQLEEIAVPEPNVEPGVEPGDESGDGTEDGWFGCYEETEPAAATACFEAYVASGEIGPTDVPVVLRHPECGYADVSWTNEIYSLPDADFIAAAESARACFLDLVERGEVSEYELPSEISHLECFEGRNWYQVFDDREYDDRYYECIGGTIGD